MQDVYDIRKTTNRGQSWFNPAPNVTSEWYIQLLNEGIGYSSGEEPSGGYALNLFKRSDGLENWSKLFINDNFADVYFVSEEKGYAISGVLSQTQVLYKTTDGGINWASVPGAPGGDDLLFLDSLTGFIGSNLIYKTTDGGVTWYVPNGGQGGAGKIFFINQSIGWAIQSNIIYKTTNRGENWFTQFTASASIHFTNINFVDTLYGWVSGGRPFKTTDGGANWIEQTFTTLWNSDDVYFTDIDTGWFAKYSSINNSLFKTTDGGLNWVGISEVIGARKLFFFPDPIHWLTLGFSRYYWTNDYGNSWQEFTEDVPMGLISFFAPTNYLGYSVGKGGLILRYDDGVTNILQTNENIIADHFYLYQNFPNPFNPTTTIKYEIPERSFVSIRVFDVLGNEITTLVNEEKPAGGFKVEFNGANLPSGIYFYKLTAGEYNSTRKFTLLK